MFESVDERGKRRLAYPINDEPEVITSFSISHGPEFLLKSSV